MIVARETSGGAPLAIGMFEKPVESHMDLTPLPSASPGPINCWTKSPVVLWGTGP
jgi:hypothetical protein